MGVFKEKDKTHTVSIGFFLDQMVSDCYIAPFKSNQCCLNEREKMALRENFNQYELKAASLEEIQDVIERDNWKEKKTFSAMLESLIRIHPCEKVKAFAREQLELNG